MGSTEKYDEKYDEMHVSPGSVRAHYQNYAAWLARQPEGVMRSRRSRGDFSQSRHYLCGVWREG
jgi:uncharacterized circularly permuted ATP-grasp superfamily protein